MKFLDINGNDLVLTLNKAYAVTKAGITVTGWPFTADYYFLFEFVNSGANKVYVLAPIATPTTANIKDDPRVIDVSKLDTFSPFQSPSTGATVSLDAFNYLNQPDYSRFYHVTNTDLTTTVLLSNTVLQLATSLTNPLAASPIAFTPDYVKSGNFLCYGSSETSGLFQ